MLRLLTGAMGRLAAFWWRHDWWGIALLTILALVLGFIGFRVHFPADEWSTSDVLYLTLQLLTLESGFSYRDGSTDAPKQASLLLNWARFIGAFVLSYAAIRAGMELFRERADRLAVRFFRRPVIVCGLSEAGIAIARSFASTGHRVVALELDRDNDGLARCRAAGVTVLIGDGRNAGDLAAAGIRRAERLFCVMATDAANAEIACVARTLAPRRRASGVLLVHVHISDADLIRALRDHDLETPETAPVRIDYFNIAETGARAMLDRTSPFTAASRAGETPRLFLVGPGPVADAIAVEAICRWRLLTQCQDACLPITMVGRDAADHALMLAARRPDLFASGMPGAVDLDPRGAVFRRGEFLAAATCKQPQSTAVYVTIDDEREALLAGVELADMMQGVPVTVAVPRAAGLANLLAADGFTVVGLLDDGCNRTVVLAGLTERLGRAIHEAYVQAAIARGETPGANASLAAWDDLPEHYREDNREQARHIREKLSAFGYRIAFRDDPAEKLLTFPPEDEEAMAEMEHERWVAGKRGDGWTFGAGPKNPDRKTHPCLVPFADLPEVEKQKDRDAVRNIPRLTAIAGFRIYRPAAIGNEQGAGKDTGHGEHVQQRA